MKKKYYVFIAIFSILLISIFAFMVKDEQLDPNSSQINELYSYLGKVDIYHCGGLNTYSDGEVNQDNISIENKLCMAYYNLDSKIIKEDSKTSKEKNKNDVNICKIGDITLAANEDKICNYETFSKEELNKAYKDLYGTNIKDYNNFEISNTNSCYLEGDSYYCGLGETYSIAITPNISIYRLKTQSLKKQNGNIVIIDYFLRITDNKCYVNNTTEEESTTCTKALSKLDNFDNLSDSKKAEFLKKYGTKYKHYYVLDNDNYYWEKSIKK